MIQGCGAVWGSMSSWRRIGAVNTIAQACIEGLWKDSTDYLTRFYENTSLTYAAVYSFSLA
jgi:hypothetical protein